MDQVAIGAGAAGFNFLPVHVAIRTGIFAKYDLSVTPRRLGGVENTTAAVRDGEILLGVTPPEGAIADFLKGGPLRVVAGNFNALPLTLIAHPRFKRIEDLRGARLGTSSLTEGTALYTQEMLSRHGLHYPSDYTFVLAGTHITRWAALQAGTIDAAVQLIPLNFVALEEGWSNLGECADYIPQIAFTTWLANPSLAAGRGDALARALQALKEATRMLRDPAHRGDMEAIAAEVTETAPALSKRALALLIEKDMLSPDLSIPDAALDTTIGLMRKLGLIQAEDAGRAASAFDRTFLSPP